MIGPLASVSKAQPEQPNPMRAPFGLFERNQAELDDPGAFVGRLNERKMSLFMRAA
jgi:hypothetical protein